MGWLDKLFGKKTKEEEKNATAGTSGRPPLEGLEHLRFGHYSDNNKSYAKTRRWYDAEDRFKEKAYNESFSALFDYLRDDAEDNIQFRPDGNKFTFTLTQGSKKIYGESDGVHVTAQSSLARMQNPSNAVMRRLLELNYSMYYNRCAMREDNVLCMIFDTPVSAASPSKMYYALRELAIKADKQDDLLIADFSTLQATDTEHIVFLNNEELDIKYTYFRKWIESTLQRVSELNQDSFSGAIAYMLLALIYRIDFLIAPEAKLLSELEKISALYWEKKEEVTLIERNQLMKDAVRKLLDVSREEFRTNVYRPKGAFAASSPPPPDKMKESITGAVKDAVWYTDNKYPDIALMILEYGIVYNLYTFSMPKVFSDLSIIVIAVLHPEFFAALGLKQQLYDPAGNIFNKDAIIQATDEAIGRFKDKYEKLEWDHKRLKWESLYAFVAAYTDEMAHMNLEVKR